MPAGPPGDEKETAEQERPREVELLLDREGPEVQHRARVHARCEVVGRLLDEVPVREVQERGTEAAGDVRDLEWGRDDRVSQRSEYEHRRRGRKDPTEPARVEPTEIDPVALHEIAQEDPGHEVT